MKICAIINFWDGEELLPYCINNWKKCVDAVIVVYSNKSNHALTQKDNDQYVTTGDNVYWVNCEPNWIKTPMINERDKRNFGLQVARDMGFDLFVMSDCDEFYDPQMFHEELKRFTNSKLQGLVCASQVYFKSPTLTIGLDITRVTFIHRVTKNLKFELNSKYPFAFDGRNIYIDPTRQLNIFNGVEWSQIVMHHYSWVRKDFERKIKNSTASVNLERSSIREDLVLAKEGYFVNFYGKELVRVPNLFEIPEMNV
jgi:hypothetical protein